MFVTSPIDSASWWLNASNVIYVSGAVLTLAAAVHVLLEKRAVLTGKRSKESFWAEASVFLAALVSVIGTIGAIHYSNSLNKLKDLDLNRYEKQADVQIAQANTGAAKAISDAATANQQAQDAKLKAQETERSNISLKIELTKHEGQEKESEAKLTAQNQQTAQFVQGVAQQQQGMAQQMQATPSLGVAQIQIVADRLKPFSGRTITIMSMIDAHC